MRIILAFGLLALASAAPAEAQDCTLCFSTPAAQAGAKADERPLTIEISTGLAFSRLALAGHDGGSAAIDPQTGAKITGHGLIDLGGSAVQGRGRISGTPGRQVRIDLPRSVTMSSTDGSTAVLTELTTDLPAWPVLDSSGILEFSFGGRLEVRGQGGGNFRGRIPISVDYN
ncbi:MAG TPA: DUF4402 domain-containing protein [Novosphingobium sp.]|nr:DUF4402 domain-containing protein [Novosphingobium sp.]